jgi:plastocyanin
MQFLGRALLASAVALAACAGSDSPADTAAAGNMAATPAPGTSGTAAPAVAPVTGTTHDVQMVFEGGKYLFVPDQITVKEGDAIKFINVSGGPHNVQFKEENVPDDMEATLASNMPDGAMAKMGPLNGPLLMQLNETYTISFAGIKAGEYPFTCTPHEAMGMNGTVIVQ